MTLLVARKQSDRAVWMIADTAITGGNIPLRERKFSPKIFPVQGGRALAGFAGDPVLGLRAIAELDDIPDAKSAVDHLKKRRQGTERLGFAYAWFDGEAHLVRVDDNKVTPQEVLHLGDQAATEQFQGERFDATIVHPPDALAMLQTASRDELFDPDETLGEAIYALWRLMAARPQHDVGGWVTPYALTSNGASLLPYAYSSTDPILSRLLPGEVVPHGTATGGGFGFSLTELPDHTGLVAYWKQISSGLIIRRQGNEIETHNVLGEPAEFKEKAKSEYGIAVDLWFGEEKQIRATRTQEICDEQGRPRLQVLEDENGTYAYRWLRRTAGSFYASGLITDTGDE